ncbi:hypothetical protein [Vibrio owensii]|uniref:hypothetical protein n=1 Tax=Vibrio harveyi group TaxID=717610 RepID=UPI003CC6A76C
MIHTILTSFDKLKPRVLETLIQEIQTSKLNSTTPLTLEICKDDNQEWHEVIKDLDILMGSKAQTVILIRKGNNIIHAVAFGDCVEDQVDGLSFLLENPILQTDRLEKHQELTRLIMSRLRNEAHFRVKASTYIEVTKGELELTAA